ncbi:hypothetical protein JCM10212_005846 [Sporobolomyces blumeae]
MSDSGGWSLTESDPGVFTGLLHDLGVTGLEVEELWGLDQDLLKQLEPVHALVFLFKWIGHGTETMDGSFVTPSRPHYFAHQVITNACASIALLNATLNIEDDNVQLGDELGNLKAFSDGLDPQTRGEIITNSQKIREVHNSFARSDPFHLEEHRPQDESEDAYHFITYLPIGGELYELDGLKQSPVSHGPIPAGSNWTDLARKVLENRIAKHPPGEVMFNLLAITSRLTSLRSRLASLSSTAEGAASTSGGGGDREMEKVELRMRIEEIEQRHEGWKVENELRRHNYIGFVHALLIELAKSSKLEPLISNAKETMKRKIEERKAKGLGGADEMDLED